MRIIYFIGSIILLLSSCKYNPCGDRDICATLNVHLHNCPIIPQNIKLYIYPEGNGFKTPIEEKTHNGEPYVYDQYSNMAFGLAFTKGRDYRLVLNDSIFFDIDKIAYDVYVDSAHWNMSGPVKSCAIVYAEVNGRTLGKEYLYTNYLYFPYSMHKVVHKREN